MAIRADIEAALQARIHELPRGTKVPDRRSQSPPLIIVRTAGIIEDEDISLELRGARVYCAVIPDKFDPAEITNAARVIIEDAGFTVSSITPIDNSTIPGVDIPVDAELMHVW